MIIISGRTFEHRQHLKELGARWDNDNKQWFMNYCTLAKMSELEKMVGVIIRHVGIDLGTEEEKEPVTVVGNTALYGDDFQYLNYFKDKNPLAFFGFSSLQKMIDYINSIKPEFRKTGWSRETRYQEWAGTASMSEAIDLALNGWQHGADQARALAERMSVEHASKHRRSYSVAGGSVSVGRLLTGNPRHMIKRPRQPGRRVVTLMIENGAASKISSETMIARAAAIGATVDIMEREGYSCEIVAVWVNLRDPEREIAGAQLTVKLKNAGERLNMNDLAFSLGHPSFLRRLGFACVRSSIECRSIYATMGWPTDAFRENYQPAKNEFYIRHLPAYMQEEMKKLSPMEKALVIAKTIEPLKLSLNMKDE